MEARDVRILRRAALAAAVLVCAVTPLQAALDMSAAITRQQTILLDELARGTGRPSNIKLRRPLVDAQRNRVYFAGTVSPYLGMIDAVTDEIVDSMDLGIHGYLSKQMDLDAGTGLIYLVTLEDPRLYKVDPVNKTVSAPVGVPGGGAVSVDSVNHLIYVAASNGVREYDGNLQLIRTLTASGVRDVKVDPSGTYLYTTPSVQPSSVTVYDRSTFAKIASVSMPGGRTAMTLSVDGDNRTYAACLPPYLAIISTQASAVDYAIRSMVVISTYVGNTATYGNNLYMMTGYPQEVGYMPASDGAYGVVEVRNKITGVFVSSVQAGLQGDGLAIHPGLGKMYVGNTGDSYVDVFDLATNARTKRIDTATSVEDIVVRPGDGALIVRNRLGGGNSLLLVSNPGGSAAVGDAPSPGNWPTKTILDAGTTTVYTLSHYESKVSAFDLNTLQVKTAVSLGVAKLRTDGLSTMAFDPAARTAYATLPELGQIVAANVDTGQASAAVSIPGFDLANAESPGLLQLAVNSALGRVYLLNTQAPVKLFIYDNSLTLLRSSDVSSNFPTFDGGIPLDLLFSDEDAGKLYVGPLIFNVTSGGEQYAGKLAIADGQGFPHKVVAVYPEGDRLYAVDFASTTSPLAHDSHERLLEFSRSSPAAALRQFELSPVDVVKSAFGFDFARGLAYVGYFESGNIDVLRIGAVVSEQGEVSSSTQSAFGVYSSHGTNSWFMAAAGLDQEGFYEWSDGHMSTLGARWTRFSLAAAWAYIEPTLGGGYDWTTTGGPGGAPDPLLAAVYEAPNDINAVVNIQSLSFGTGAPTRSPFTNPAEYQAFVQALAERYDGDGDQDAPAASPVRVNYFQLANEMQDWFDRGLSTAQYAQAAKMTLDSLRAANSQAQLVLVGGFTSQNGTLEPRYKLAVQACKDLGVDFAAIDIHWWGWGQTASSTAPWQAATIQDARQYLNSIGLSNVQIWSMENASWAGCPDGNPAQTEEDQARTLVRRYVWGRANGLDKLFWSQLEDMYEFDGSSVTMFNSMGLVDDGAQNCSDASRLNTTRQSYWAYQKLAQTTDNPVAAPAGTVSGVHDGNSVFAYQYTRKSDSQPLYVLWREGASANVTLSVTGSVYRVTNLIPDRYGNFQQSDATAVSGSLTVAVSSQPIFVSLLQTSADISSPTAPTGLSATAAASSSSVNLSWTASTDDVGVAGYNVWRDGVEVATSASTSYSDSGLAAWTTYFYAVSAFDTAGNESAPSAQSSTTARGCSFVDGGGGSGLNYDASKDAKEPQLASFGASLYAVWHEMGATASQIRMRKRDGASWTWVDDGGSNGLNYDPTKAAYSPQVAEFGASLYAAWYEMNGTANQIRVKKYDGSSWIWTDGGGAAGINYNPTKTASTPQLTVFSGKLYAAWQESNSSGIGQIRVKKYDGTSWSWADGGGGDGLNYDTTKAATNPQLTVFNGRLYAIWQERNAPFDQVRVRMYDGSSWTWVDGGGPTGLNYDAANNGDRAQLSVYNGGLYATWREGSGTLNYQIRVKKYDGTSWTWADGGGAAGINYSEGGHESQLTVLGNTLYAIWAEEFGGHISVARQVRLKKYDGISWTWADGGGTTGINYSASMAGNHQQLTVFNESLYAVWWEPKTDTSVAQIRVAVFELQTSTDISSPTVSIASPSSGAWIVGRATISVSASDDVGVTKVELYVDGALTSSMTAGPYAFTLDTTWLSSGTHSLQAKAYDSAGNAGASSSVGAAVPDERPSAYVLATTFSDKTLFKLDPSSDQIAAQRRFTSNPGRPAPDPRRRLAYLPSGGSIIALKADTLETATLAVAGLGMGGSFASLSPDGRTLAVVNGGADGLRSADDRLDLVSIDPDVWPPSASLSFSVGVGQQPIRSLIDHDGRYAVVSVRDDPTPKILVIDLASQQTTLQLTLPAGSEPEGMDLHPTLNIAYVFLHGTHKIEVLDLGASPPALLAEVPITSGKGPPFPSGGAFTPDGARLYVSGQTTNEVLLFDTSVATAPVQVSGVSLPSAQQPHDIAFLADGRAYVANTFNSQQKGDVAVIRDYTASPSTAASILTNAVIGPLYLVYFSSTAVVASSPTTPSGLAATATSSSRIALSWQPSTDDVGVRAYKIYRDGAQVALSATTTYADNALTPLTNYTYTVAAYDAQGNLSPQSASASASTLAGSGAPAPSSGPFVYGAEVYYPSTMAIGIATDVVNNTLTKVNAIKSRIGVTQRNADGSFSTTNCLPSYGNCQISDDLDAFAGVFTANGWSMAPMFQGFGSTLAVTQNDIDAYVDFIDWFITKYKTAADIQRIELINAPALGTIDGTGGAAIYTNEQLLTAQNLVYDRIKNKYPDIQVGTHGFEYHFTDPTNPTYSAMISLTELFLNKANGAQFDAWNFHGYNASSSTIIAAQSTNKYAGITGISEIRMALDANGWQNRPIIDTEHTGPSGGTVSLNTGDSADKRDAMYLVQELTIKKALKSDSGAFALSGLQPLKIITRTPGGSELAWGSLSSVSTVTLQVKAVGLLWSMLDRYPDYDSHVVGALGTNGQVWIEKFKSGDGSELYVFFKPYDFSAGAITSAEWNGGSIGLSYTLPLGRVPTSATLTDVYGSTTNVTSQASSGQIVLDVTSVPRFLALAASAVDTSSPAVPAGLTAVALSSAQINLSWTASTDNVGVAGYRVYRCQGSGCSPAVQVATPTTNAYTDSGLLPGTIYAYVVAAYDAAGNVSAQSAAASATTLVSSSALLNSLDADGFLWGTEGAVGVLDYASIGSTAAAARAAINDTLKTKYVKFRLQSNFFSSSDGGLTYSAVYCMPYPSQCMASGNVDETVKLFKANGWSMIPMLSYDPSDSNVTSAKIDVFVNFVDWFLGRYKADGNIQLLEQQNEPNTFWQGTDAQLLEMTNKVYDRVKAEHPGILVGTPGLEYWADRIDEASQRVDYFLDPVNGAKFDFWAFHGYPLAEFLGPNSFVQYPPTRTPVQNKYAGIPGILEVRKALDANGWQARRIIDTEHVGVLPVSPTFTEAEDRLEAAYMVQDLTLRRTIHTSSGSMALSGALPLKIEPRGSVAEFLYGSLNPDGSLSYNVKAVGLLLSKINGYNHAGRVSGAFDDEGTAWVEKFQSTATRKELYVFFKPFKYVSGTTLAFDGQTLNYTLTLSSLPVSVTLTDVYGTTSAVTTSQNLTLQAVNSPKYLEVTYGSLDVSSPTVVTVDPNAASVVSLQTSAGAVELSIPAQSFAESVQLTLRLPISCPGSLTELRATGVCAEIVLDKAVQPAKAATLTIAYRDGDVNGLDEKKLILARYDETYRGWVPLESAADPAGNKVIGKTGHFSTFQIMQASPTGDLDGARVYPNPFRPAKGHMSVVIDRLPAGARVSIHTLRGKLVWKADASDAGMVVWPGVNQEGRAAASGVYFVYIESGGRRRVLKAAVVR